MAKLINSRENNGLFKIALLNEVEVDSKADIETLLDLTVVHLGNQFSKKNLSEAKNVMLHIVASDKVGSPVFSIDSIKVRSHGTNDEILAYLGVVVNDNNVFDIIRLPDGLGPTTALRLGATVTTLDGSNKITLLVFLSFTNTVRRPSKLEC